MFGDQAQLNLSYLVLESIMESLSLCPTTALARAQDTTGRPLACPFFSAPPADHLDVDYTSETGMD